MAIWNPWRGCHRYSTGCKFCYIHKGDYKKGGLTQTLLSKPKNFMTLLKKNKNGTYKNKNRGKWFMYVFHQTS